MTGKLYGNNTTVNSQSDESLRIVVADSEKDTSVDAEVVIVNDIVSKERSGEKNPLPVIQILKGRQV
ncbi:hypothetical protein A2U01_0084502 [Trifolium medium]|uniref:Uncharacterized protein n=1 Tax=Trifolium medium TaxID=97028 RepID=A0A392TTS7_9FABA|nr:hypothetical protein [Trifolium medium]